MTDKNIEEAGTSTGVDKQLARHGGLSYIEIPAVDVRKSARFYEKVFGWNLMEADTDHPKFMDQTGHLLGRWVTRLAVSRDAGLLPYIYVDRINDALAYIADYGGEIVKPPYAEGNLCVSTIRDPAGNLIGLWQEAVGLL